eukprot:TRINITY_DN4507_c0_g2_i2.p2 TRINITY_DN4507_c0_g2~~TRINITY_DN4507_c0_g2_i2.p2  ORF type:complete len:145 (+),score=17.80 TRINITY_DN4507_c0_g2_i2:121-555(+)
MSQHVCADLRVKLFNATVLPVLLYGLSSLTLKPMHLSLLRGTRLKMLRNMAGWRRLDAESWHDTMHRMRQRVDRLLASTSCPEISSMLASSRWRLAKRLLIDFLRPLPRCSVDLVGLSDATPSIGSSMAALTACFVWLFCSVAF